MKNLTTAQLLEEISHAEQIGTPADTYLLVLKEELNNRKEQRSTIKVQPTKPITLDLPQEVEITYTKNARAYISNEYIEFHGREAGEKKYTMPIADIYHDTHLLSFYRSEYLTNGIKARVMNYLSK